MIGKEKLSDPSRIRKRISLTALISKTPTHQTNIFRLALACTAMHSKHLSESQLHLGQPFTPKGLGKRK